MQSARCRIRQLGVLLVAALLVTGAGCEEELDKIRRELARAIQPKAPPPAPAPKEAEEVPPPPTALPGVAEEVQITTDPSVELWPRVTPDGKFLLFASRKTGTVELFALDLVNPRVQYQLTTSGGNKCRVTQNPDGTVLIYDRTDVGPDTSRLSLFRFSRPDGQEMPLVSRAIHVLTPELSMDGRRLAFSLAELSADAARLVACEPPLHQALANAQPSLWVANPDGSGSVHLGRGFYPRWSRDGRRLAFVSFATGNADIWTVNLDGSDLTQLTSDPSHEIDPAWSPDGTQLVFSSNRLSPMNFDLWMFDLRDGRLVQLTADQGHDGGATWGPDGRSIYFHSYRNGNWDIYRVAPVLR
jgi:Tol biopolymer transport system component